MCTVHTIYMMDVASLAIDALEVSRSTSSSIILILCITEPHTYLRKCTGSKEVIMFGFYEHNVLKHPVCVASLTFSPAMQHGK